MALKRSDREIVKSGVLVTASSNYSALALNIFATLCVKVKEKLDSLRYVSDNLDESNNLIDKRLLPDWVDLGDIPTTYNISKKELQELWGVSASSLRDSSRKRIDAVTKEIIVTPNPIKEACLEILRHSVIELDTYTKASSTEPDTWEAFMAFESVKYGSDGLTFEIKSKALNIIYDESRGFASSDLKTFFKLKGKFSKRWLEILSQYKKINNPIRRTFTIGQIEKMLKTPRKLVKDSEGKRIEGYAETGGFLLATVEKPLAELQRISKKYGGDKIWRTEYSNEPLYTMVRQSKNRTYDSDKVIINLVYLDRIQESLNQLESHLDKPICLSNDNPSKWRNTLLLVKELRSSNRKPTNAEKQLLELASDELIEAKQATFKELKNWV